MIEMDSSGQVFRFQSERLKTGPAVYIDLVNYSQNGCLEGEGRGTAD